MDSNTLERFNTQDSIGETFDFNNIQNIFDEQDQFHFNELIDVIADYNANKDQLERENISATEQHLFSHPSSWSELGAL